MKNSTFRALVIITTTLFSLLSGSITAQKQVAATDTFPPNFGAGNTYLYVLTERGYWQQNKAMTKYFKKYYKGDYEVINNIDYLSSTQKEGVHVYTFQMLYDHSYAQKVSELPWHSCMVFDTETKTRYSYPEFKASYKKVLQYYVPRLEQIRMRNSFNSRK